MKEQDFRIGQVIFAMSKSTGKIEPAQIVEIIIKQGMGYDIKTVYMVRHISELADARDMSSMLDKYIYFPSIDDARKDLLNRAQLTVSKLCAQAEDLVHKHFPSVEEDKQPGSTEQKGASKMHHSVDDDEWVTVDIGDGQVAKMRKPVAG